MTTPFLDYVLVWSKFNTNGYTSGLFCKINICKRCLHKQIVFACLMHWVSRWHWPCSDLQTLFFLNSLLKKSISNFKHSDLLTGSHKLLLLFLYVLTAVTCNYPTQSNNETKFNKVQSLHTFCHHSYIPCCKPSATSPCGDFVAWSSHVL